MVRLCDKCGRAKDVRTVTLGVDTVVFLGKTEITLELCSDCAAKLYAEADKLIRELAKKFSDFKASMNLVEPEEEEEEDEDEVSPEFRRLWHERSKKFVDEWMTEVRKKLFGDRFRMVLKARKDRQCAFCGLPALKPVRCPKCGVWVCSEHLGAHMRIHYVKLTV